MDPSQEGSHYDEEGNELFYVKDGYYYSSYAEYQRLYKDWEDKRAICKDYADEVIKCMDLQQKTAVIFELFRGDNESVVLSREQLYEASVYTKEIKESHMIEVADTIDKLYDSMEGECDYCKKGMDYLDDVSGSLNVYGDKYTKLHNEAYPAYKSACDAIHVPVEKFI